MRSRVVDETSKHSGRRLARRSECDLLPRTGIIDRVGRSVLCIPRVHDDNVARSSQSLKSIRVRLVVAVVERHFAKLLLDQLTGSPCDSFGERVDRDRLAAQNTRDVLALFFDLNVRTESFKRALLIEVGRKKLEKLPLFFADATVPRT